MTIDIVKNMPNIPRTDDVGIIMDNFATYYRELYCDKPVHIPTLDRMINNESSFSDTCLQHLSR